MVTALVGPSTTVSQSTGSRHERVPVATESIGGGPDLLHHGLHRHGRAVVSWATVTCSDEEHRGPAKASRPTVRMTRATMSSMMVSRRRP